MSNFNDMQDSHVSPETSDLGLESSGSPARRRFVKGVTLGLPAVLTLCSGARLAAATGPQQCIDNLKELTPSAFDPGGNWVTFQVKVDTYTVSQSDSSKYVEIYSDKENQLRFKALSSNLGSGNQPGDPVPSTFLKDNSLTYLNLSKTESALAYYAYDTLTSKYELVWYGFIPPGTNSPGDPLTGSCCTSLGGCV